MDKQLLYRLGFILALSFAGIVSSHPIARIVLGGLLFLIAVLLLVLTVTKPKHRKGKATIMSIRKVGNESIYKLRFDPETLEVLPEEAGPVYADSARYDDNGKTGEVGDTVEAGIYSVGNGENKTYKGIITEKGYRVHAQKYLKLYIPALLIGLSICVWGVVGQFLS